MDSEPDAPQLSLDFCQRKDRPMIRRRRRSPRERHALAQLAVAAAALQSVCAVVLDLDALQPEAREVIRESLERLVGNVASSVRSLRAPAAPAPPPTASPPARPALRLLTGGRGR